MNNRSVKKLEVGDVIYASRYGKLVSRYKIERVTQTQAISGNQRFKREYHNGGFVRAVGTTTGWNTSLYKIATPELDAEFGKAVIISQLKKINFKDLTLEQLTKIKNIIEEQK